MFPQDSIAVESGGAEEVINLQPHQHQARTLQPWQIAKMMPRDATPQQLDSAIQANIKPGPIHWSQRPDTLHLPGEQPPKSLLDVELPQYYKESFFQKSPMFHPELPGGRQGVAGDPVPYTLAGDNLVTGVILGCFILSLLVFSVAGNFFMHQARNFFRTPHFGTTPVTETTNELRFQLFFVFQTCLFLSIGGTYYLQFSLGNTFSIEPSAVIGIFALVLLAYFLLKAICYSFADWVFFDRKKNEQWLKSFLVLISLEGLMLFPGVVLQTYFNMAFNTIIIYAIVVVIFIKVLSFYKCYIIFFRRTGGFLQNILYFCSLEIIPLIALNGVINLISNDLKINI